MRRSRCCGNRIGYYFAAFGFGMVIALLCPNAVVLGILAIAIIVLGIIIGK